MLVLREEGGESAGVGASEADVRAADRATRAASPSPSRGRRAGLGVDRLTLRALALWVHRYVGLLMAVFLVVAGLTGSLLAFYSELDQALSPSSYAVRPPVQNARPLDPFEQREALARQLPPGLRAHRISFEARDGVASLLEATPAPDGPSDADDEYFLDPYTGRVLGSRRWGDITQGVVNLLPFIYRLHYSLGLGSVGATLFGIVALLWTIDCFVGAYLTLPPRSSRGRGGPRVWLARWKPAWLVRGGQLFSWVFTWHRASGLWVWGMLLVFAWSAVALNLRDVYEPVMVAAFGLEDPAYARLPKHDPPMAAPKLDFRDAAARGRALMADQARARGFDVLRERRLVYQPEIDAFRYQVETSLDVSDRNAGTVVYLAGSDGHFLAFEAPTGQNAGRTVTTWIYQLHFAAVRGLGLPYRAFVCVLGLAVAALSVTGVWVWWVKRAKRLAACPAPP